MRESPTWVVLGQRRSLLGTGVMALASLAALAGLAAFCRAQGLPAPSAGSLAAIAAGAMPLAVAALWQRLA